MVYSSILVALVSRRRSRSGRVKGIPMVRVGFASEKHVNTYTHRLDNRA
jgi:hypothetical protein